MINLLPPQYKEYLKEEEVYRVILILTVLVFLFLASLFLVLFSVKIYISGEAQNQKVLLEVAKQEFEASKTKEIEKEIQSINQKLSHLNSFYKNQPHYVNLLEKISSSLPAGVYLNSLSLRYLSPDEGMEISLRGFSPSRELLSEFKKSLEENPNFSELEFPLSNWINPDNFSVNFKAK